MCQARGWMYGEKIFFKQMHFKAILVILYYQMNF